MFFSNRRKGRTPAKPAFVPKLESLEIRLNPMVIANPDQYLAAKGQVLTIPVTQGVLVNDFNDTNPGAILSSTVNLGAKYSNPNSPPLPLGTLTLAQNGSFTLIVPSDYKAANGDIIFQYRVVDRDTADPAAFGDVTINITGSAGGQRLFATAAGSGAGPHVRVFETASGVERFSFFPYEPSFTGGVRVATGDLNRDGVDDIATAPASGGSARIKVFDGKFGSQLEDFFVFEPTFRGGADVAVGDVDGDGFNDLLVGAGDGGGPRVIVYDGTGTGNLTTPTQSSLSNTKLLDFFAYESTFRSGVRVAAGDLDGLTKIDPANARDYIVTGTFNGGGPAVRVFDGRDVKNALQIGIPEPPPLRAFFAFDQNGRTGVNVAVGIFRTDGKADIVTGTGTGFTTVRVFDGRSTSLLREFTVPTGENPSGGTPTGPGSGTGLFNAGGQSGSGTPSSLLSTQTTGAAPIGGVRVAVTDRNADGLSDILTGIGPGVSARVRIFDGNSLQEINNFLAYQTGFLGGVFVGGNSL